MFYDAFYFQNNVEHDISPMGILSLLSKSGPQRELVISIGDHLCQSSVDEKRKASFSSIPMTLAMGVLIRSEGYCEGKRARV